VVKKREILPVVLSPTKYDEGVDKKVMPAYGFNEELAIYTKISAEVAKQNDVAFIDIHTLMTALNVAKQRDDKKFWLYH
jgi:hypothetical protein